MTLSQGTRIGPYEIVGQIGAGGMGVVYRATDTRLKRDVAIKVLPASLADDAERLSRFRREAELLASLNHPNIAHIHGLEESGGTTALILELVEGPTLADRIAEGPLPVDEALEIALQIAEALEAAHGQGIVHRDLKPANIKLKDDRLVKVLDFGIAKALDIRAASGLSPVMETPTVTETGIILGTAAYMSPEQARGKGVDQRTDIWAFGCVLYEMLTGQQAFGGEDVTIMLARILEREPDMAALPKSVSPAVRHTIELCHRKDVRQRLADIRDAKLSLGGALVPAGLVEAELAVGQPDRPQLPAVAAALLVGLALAGAIAWSVRPTPEPRALNRFAYVVPADHVFRWDEDASVLALAPDGRQFVYNTEDGLYSRRMDELEPRLIPGTEEDLLTPFFSPDGQFVAYLAVQDNQLKRISSIGGVPVVIATNVTELAGASWNADGTIVFGGSEGIYRVSATGGSPELLIPAAEQELLRSPHMLPDGESVLFSSLGPADYASNVGQLVVQSISTGTRTDLGLRGDDARLLPTGHLMYAFEEGLFAAPFDPETLTVGNSAPLLQGVALTGAGSANYGVASDGTLVYLRPAPDVQETRTIVWADRDGREVPFISENRAYEHIMLSPDDQRLAVWVGNDDDDGGDILLYDVNTGQGRPITFGTRPTSTQIWDWDGRRIAYATDSGIDWQAADGTGEPETLILNTTERSLFPYAFSPNNEHLLFGQFGQAYEIHMLSMQSGAEPQPLIADLRGQFDAKISPDGDWIAYISTETGRGEVYIRPFPDVRGGKWQISAGEGGYFPVFWGPDGKEIFYIRGGFLMAVSLEAGPAASGAPEALFPIAGISDGNPAYVVARDGRFLLVKVTTDEPEDSRRQIIIVENWLEELERLVPSD